jgi:hypothetical protein
MSMSNPRRPLRTALLGALGVSTLVVACASSETGSPITDACGKQFDAIAKREARCSKSVSDYRSDTRDAYVKSCLLRARAPGSGLTVAHLNGCVAAINAENTACPSLSNVPACQQPRGTLGDGTACLIDAQCAGGLCVRAAGGSETS